MKILLATDQSAADALNDKATDFVVGEQHSKASRWSPIYTDGARFGVAVNRSVLAAFTNEELGTQTSGELITHLNVIDADIATAAAPDAGWREVPPPPPPPQEEMP